MEPLLPYETDSDSSAQPIPDNSRQEAATSKALQTTRDISPDDSTDFLFYNYHAVRIRWRTLVCGESHYVWESHTDAAIAQRTPGLSTRMFKIKRDLCAYKHVFGCPKIDREKFPHGESLTAIQEQARRGEKCKEHDGHKCFCVAYYDKGNRITYDWKPFATGKYMAMKRKEDCELHGGRRCYCVVRPSETEVVYSYDLKTGKRTQM